MTVILLNKYGYGAKIVDYYENKVYHYANKVDDYAYKENHNIMYYKCVNIIISNSLSFPESLAYAFANSQILDFRILKILINR